MAPCMRRLLHCSEIRHSLMTDKSHDLMRLANIHIPWSLNYDLRNSLNTG